MIATNWHWVQDAVRSNQIRVLTATESSLDDLPLMDHTQYNLNVFKEMVELMATTPRFVISNDVLEIGVTDQSMMSLNDMSVCGVLRLPFSTCVVEFNDTDANYHVYIREVTTSEDERFWLCSTVAFRRESKISEYAIAFPCMIQIKVSSAPGEPHDSDTVPPEQPILQYNVFAEQFLSDDLDYSKALDEIYPVAFNRCFVAYISAMLLSRTIGLRQDVERIKEAFNRGRVLKGRCRIPDHTTIRLGSYLSAAGSSHTIESRSGVQVHLRRAHKKRVAFGPGRAQREWRFFPAQVVGFLPDGRKPSLPEMLATRASKPYIVR